VSIPAPKRCSRPSRAARGTRTRRSRLWSDRMWSGTVLQASRGRFENKTGQAWPNELGRLVAEIFFYKYVISNETA
jgi:hypothetical protein